jgi:aspartate/methionine/tyrosine aminotransferase
MATQPKLSWVEPRSGTTALVKFDLDMSSYEFCISLLKQTGVMFTPGSSFDMEGYVRIGYANNPKILQTGLERVSDFLLRH